MEAGANGHGFERTMHERHAMPLLHSFIGGLALAVILPSCAHDPKPPTPAASDAITLVEWLRSHGKPPVDYVVQKFARHDVVMVGEHHHVRENCEFVARIVPQLPAHGIHRLVTEFARSSQQADLDRLVAGKASDRELAIAILRELPWPTWGFREYLDIFEAAWRANQERHPDAQPFRILGMDSDWRQHQLWFEVDSPAASFQIRLARERHMIRVLEEQVLAGGHQALVHLGFAHSVMNHGERLGTVLHEKYGERLFQVCLHHDISPKLTPLLESAFAQVGGQPVAFDVRGSPFDGLWDDGAPGFRMMRDRELSALARSYVFLAPVKELRKVRWLPGFLTAAKFDEGLAVALKAGWVEKDSCKNAEELDQAMARRFPADG
jgi:hypothetical protein